MRDKREKMQKLGLIEFREVFFESLDTIIMTSLLHIDENKPFYEEVVFKLFDIYQRENSNYSVKELILFFHVFLHSMFKHKPSVEKNEDDIKIF